MEKPNQEDLNFTEMKQMQEELRIAKGWTDTDPNNAKDHLLNLIGEVGEVADIFKKKGIDKCMNSPQVRRMLVEEMADMEMYFIEVMNRLQITPEEFARAYITKHNRLMQRDFKKKWEHDIVDESQKGDERE